MHTQTTQMALGKWQSFARCCFSSLCCVVVLRFHGTNGRAVSFMQCDAKGHCNSQISIPIMTRSYERALNQTAQPAENCKNMQRKSILETKVKTSFTQNANPKMLCLPVCLLMGSLPACCFVRQNCQHTESQSVLAHLTKRERIVSVRLLVRSRDRP